MILKNPDGTITHYEKFGDKPYLEQDRTSKTLLLLHGIGADHAMWEPQIQKYASLGYRVLVLDLFGHGLSSNLSNIDLSDWHNQINWLLEHNNVEKCTLIGVSMGGVIAQSFVVAHPEMVEAIIIADSFGELSTFQERMLGVSAVFGFYLFKILGKNSLNKIEQNGCVLYVS